MRTFPDASRGLAPLRLAPGKCRIWPLGKLEIPSQEMSMLTWGWDGAGRCAKRVDDVLGHLSLRDGVQNRSDSG